MSAHGCHPHLGPAGGELSLWAETHLLPVSWAGLIAGGGKERAANGKRHFNLLECLGRGNKVRFGERQREKWTGAGNGSLPYSYAAPLHAQIKWSLLSSLLLSSHTLSWLILSSSRSEIR